ncbi:MAG: hypothetical protein NT056_05245 [Proteobacteria bacterium]|nr:hypothetical protein [Pseudomonadota bacterium]
MLERWKARKPESCTSRVLRLAFFRAAVGGLLLAVILVPAVRPAFAGGLVKANSKNPEAQKLIDQAWKLEKSDYSAEIFRQCIPLLEQADKLDPQNADILSAVSRYYWSYGDELPKQTPEQRKTLEGLYARGMEIAEESLKIAETPAGHYWSAVNKAASLEFSSIFTQAAGFLTVNKHYQYVAKNDPDYYYGAAGRLWTEVISRVPRKVVEMVGRKYVEEAVMQIDRAIEKEPRYLDNYAYKARFMYVFYKNREEALKLLDQALQMGPNCFPEEDALTRVGLRNGMRLWKKIAGKDYPEK